MHSSLIRCSPFVNFGPVIIFFAATLLSAFAPQGTSSFDCHSYMKSLQQLPLPRRQEKIRNMDLGTQFNLYLCGFAVHPPFFETKEPIVASGKNAIGFFKEKLRHATDDAVVDKIILILTAMQSRETYDAAADTELMELLRSRVMSVQDTAERNLASNRLAQLERYRIASQGKTAVNYLKKKLRQPSNDAAVEDVMWIVLIMSSKKTYDVAGDKELMALLRSRIDNMDDKVTREVGQEILAGIEGVEDLATYIRRWTHE